MTSYYGVREPDSPRFRLWEVAGTSHVSVGKARGTHRGRLELDVLLARVQRRGPPPAPLDQRRCRATDDAARRGQTRRTPSRGGPRRTRQRRGRHSAAGYRRSDRIAQRLRNATRRIPVRIPLRHRHRLRRRRNSPSCIRTATSYLRGLEQAALDRAVEQGMVLPEDAGPMRDQAAANGPRDWTARKSRGRHSSGHAATNRPVLVCWERGVGDGLVPSRRPRRRHVRRRRAIDGRPQGSSGRPQGSPLRRACVSMVWSAFEEIPCTTSSCAISARSLRCAARVRSLRLRSAST